MRDPRPAVPKEWRHGQPGLHPHHPAVLHATRTACAPGCPLAAHRQLCLGRLRPGRQVQVLLVHSSIKEGGRRRLGIGARARNKHRLLSRRLLGRRRLRLLLLQRQAVCLPLGMG